MPLTAVVLSIQSVFDYSSECVCAGWIVTVDQAVPLLETQGAEPTSDAAPPTGSDTTVYTAPITG